MASRKQLLETDINQALKLTSSGTPRYKLEKKLILTAFIEDLMTINQLIPKLSSVQAPAIRDIVQLWRARGNSVKTIQRKVGILRKVITRYVTNKSFPSNEALNIKYTVPKKSIELQTTTPSSIKHKRVRDICKLQFYFGLKKLEAIRFSAYMINKSRILIPRAVAYNQRDRFVPITMTRQRQFIHLFLTRYEEGFVDDYYDEKLMSLLHTRELKKINIKDSDYFRWLYLKNRYQTLISIERNEQQCLQRLRHELGYRENRQIKEMLVCLNDS